MTDKDTLHAAILNLPCKPEALADIAHHHAESAYKHGHRDARHAAAELVAAAPAVDWRVHAVAWLNAKADEQQATNEKYPRHAACYPSWTERVKWWRNAAEDLARATLAPTPPAVVAAPSASGVLTDAAPVAWRHRTRHQENNFEQPVWGKWRHTSDEPQGQPSSMFQKEPLYAAAPSPADQPKEQK